MKIHINKPDLFISGAFKHQFPRYHIFMSEYTSRRWIDKDLHMPRRNHGCAVSKKPID
jgi:hypothetical protein